MQPQRCNEVKPMPSDKIRPLLIGLFVAGAIGVFLSTTMLFLSTVLMALIGGAAWRWGSPASLRWDEPKELRLVHFAFWFFVLTATTNWLFTGLPPLSVTSALGIILLLLFWPLALALVAGRFRAQHLFFSVAAVTAVTALMMLWPVGATTGGANGHIAPAKPGFTCGLISVIGALYFARQRQNLAAGFSALAGCTAVTIALLRGLTPLGSEADAASVITDQGMLVCAGWIGLINIPAAVFLQNARSHNTTGALLAVSGLAIPLTTVLFGFLDVAILQPAYLVMYLVLTVAFATTLFVELDLGCHRQRRVKVSATIITKNEADNIEDCLKSVRAVADEIIVLDSGSTDNTVALARPLADILEETDWPGFGIQKQRALEKATGDWVLSIDADERISEGLAREINDRLANPDADAYKLPWAVTIYGRRLDFGRSGRAPLRLFRRDGVRFSDALVHERILIPEGRKTRTLRGRLTHYTHRDFGHSLEKSAKYAWLGSLEKGRKGKKTRTMIYPTLRGLMTFVQVYFIRFGFLDGAVGYLTAVTYAQVTFNKYAGLWTLGRGESRR